MRLLESLDQPFQQQQLAYSRDAVDNDDEACKAAKSLVLLILKKM
jgi:hypothetical protein